jgi:hypothetical protein
MNNSRSILDNSRVTLCIGNDIVVNLVNILIKPNAKHYLELRLIKLVPSTFVNRVSPFN